jgi:hypothetical protein
MYTTSNATREHGLKAAAAARRAMKRHKCCKSQFKFMCFSCGKMIFRGDKITRCNTTPTGMTLRFRGADIQNNLTMEETAFYQTGTGTNMWVHISCKPCYWESLPVDSNEYSPPSLRRIFTEWDWKVQNEFDNWSGSSEWFGGLYDFIDCNTDAFAHFCSMKGYPKRKHMEDRIIHSVTRFQAIWRGYLDKAAYPEALYQHRLKQHMNKQA